jgi:hypothetical protein
MEKELIFKSNSLLRFLLFISNRLIKKIRQTELLPFIHKNYQNIS